MEGFSSAHHSTRVLSFHHFPHLILAFLPRLRAQFLCGISASLLLALAGSALLLFWSGGPAAAAQAASTCPISGLPPTPTSAPPANPATIHLNELLSNPSQDWNCDGKNGTTDQWIELINTSGSDADLSGFQLLSQGSNNNLPVLLPLGTRIATHSYLVLFDAQIPKVHLFPGGGTLELLDANGQIADSINYPLSGTDQSYARASSGQWSISSTPTPGAANSFGSGSTPTPKATATKRSGGGVVGAAAAEAAGAAAASPPLAASSFPPIPLPAAWPSRTQATIHPAALVEAAARECHPGSSSRSSPSSGQRCWRSSSGICAPGIKSQRAMANQAAAGASGTLRNLSYYAYNNTRKKFESDMLRASFSPGELKRSIASHPFLYRLIARPVTWLLARESARSGRKESIRCSHDEQPRNRYRRAGRLLAG
ncbi:MAG TPA: lamin tail domain-containing protein, partial [Ktedonobacterales bacterium]